MKKLLLLILLLVLCSSSFALAHVWFFSGGGAASCASCNTGNDSRIIDDGNNADSNFSTAAWRAKQFTIASETCITGMFFVAWDEGDNEDVTCEVYTDSGGEPGSIVGAGYTGTYSNIPDAMTDSEIAFAATQTLSAGTYWFVSKPNALMYMGKDADGAGTYKYSVDSGANWSNSSNAMELGAMGCNPS